MDWDRYFRGKSELHNGAPAEALIKVIAYYLRSGAVDPHELHFLEVGCGLGHNLEWLADRDVMVSGLDLSPTAVSLAKARLARYGTSHSDYQIGRILQGVAHDLPFVDGEFDGVIEACALQHLGRDERLAAYREAARVLRSGGVFVGYCLSTAHTVFRARATEQLADDPGTLILRDPRVPGRLSDIGITHFFEPSEFRDLLPFHVECLPVMYHLPAAEARRRSFEPPYEDQFLVVWGTKP